MKKEPLVIIAGPTASGKSSLGIALAKRIGGEIISADSMQVYRGMDIGTAKITMDEMEGIAHHLIDVMEPEEPYNVAAFQQMAQDAYSGIRQRGHIPILVGGTGFYIQAFLKGVNFTPTDTDLTYREELMKIAKEDGGPQKLYDELKEKDPASAEAIHPHNVKRVIRALEFYRQTGWELSAHNSEESMRKSPYCFAFFVLTMDRKKLYDRIERRVDDMLSAGLASEVIKLKERGLSREHISMQGIGYKQMLSFLDGEISYERAVELIKRDTRRFAKRQLTWFRREKDVIWVDIDTFTDTQEILDYMCSRIREMTLTETKEQRGQ